VGGKPQLFTRLVTFSLVLGARVAPAAGVETSGFVVDTTDRHAVTAFWHRVYMASEGYWERVGWTGTYDSTATGAEGEVSEPFVADVERRVNFYRALCGVPASVDFQGSPTVLLEPTDVFQPPGSTTKRQAVQRAALMVSLSSSAGALSHNPPTSLPAWSAGAWNANNKGTIAKGFFGPGAVDAYFRESVAGVSNWNFEVGHRRWLLAVEATEMATGDTPGSFDATTQAVRQPTNLIYVRQRAGELSGASPRFVAYPAPGYFPAPLNAPYWSLSRAGADFSSAQVHMRDAEGTPLPVAVVSRETGYAENAIAWEVLADVAGRDAPADRTYHLEVTGIGGGGPDSHAWSVTLFDPNRLDEDPRPVGPDEPRASEGGVYAIDPVAACDSMETGFFRRAAADWTEGAEDGTDGFVVDRTDDSYELRSSQDQYGPGTPSDFFSDGERAYRLTFPRAYDPRTNRVPDQLFELGRDLVPAAGATLEFELRRGYMTSTTELLCERSDDGGRTWQTIGSPFAGATNSQADPSFSPHSLPLPPSGPSVRIRFRLHHAVAGTSLYDLERYPGYATGVFLDEIRVTGCDWLEPGGAVVTAPSETEVVFGTATATLPIVSGREWWLRSRAVMAGHAFPWSSPKVVHPLGALGLVGAGEPPVSGAVYGFLPDPAADGHDFEVTELVAEPWLEGAEPAPPTAIIDGTSELYELQSDRAGYRSEGEWSFRLALPPGVDEQSFQVDRTLLVSGGNTLEFWVRRGRSANQTLHAEVSSDGGATWTTVWSLAGTFNGASGGAESVDLSSFDGQMLSLRFVLRATGAASYHASLSGMWIDAVTVAGSEQLGHQTLTPLPAAATTATLDASAAGAGLVAGRSYRLRIVPRYGMAAGEPGPELRVVPTATPLSGFEGWLAYQQPGEGGDFEDESAEGVPLGLLYGLGLEPGAKAVTGDTVRLEPSMLCLERPLDGLREGVAYRAEVSCGLDGWTDTGVTVSHADGMLRAEAPRTSASCFLRWKLVAE